MFRDGDLPDFILRDEVVELVEGVGIPVGILAIKHVAGIVTHIVGTGVSMRDGKALEHLLHGLNLGEACVVESPVGHGEFRERGGHIHLIRFLARVGAEECSGEHLLRQLAVAHRITSSIVDGTARVGVQLGETVGQLITDRLELFEHLVAIHKKLTQPKLGDVVITCRLWCIGMENTLCISTIVFRVAGRLVTRGGHIDTEVTERFYRRPEINHLIMVLHVGVIHQSIG